MEWLTETFSAMGHLSLAQECLRAVVVFAWGLLLVRVAGRRVFGKWAPLDIVVSIIIGSNLSRALTGNAPFAETLAATAVMIAVHWLLSHLAARYRAISVLTEGRAVTLIQGGAPCESNLFRFGVTSNDLNELLRAQGATLDDDVSVFLETSGKLSVEKRPKD